MMTISVNVSDSNKQTKTRPELLVMCCLQLFSTSPNVIFHNTTLVQRYCGLIVLWQVLRARTKREGLDVPDTELPESDRSRLDSAGPQLAESTRAQVKIRPLTPNM